MDLLFDLDNTLINTEAARPYRENRNWREAYAQIPNFQPYDNLIELVHELTHNHRIYIVTTSPSKYAQLVCSTWNIPYSGMTAYHDTRMHKPHPEPFLGTLSQFKLNAEDCLSFGDDAKDIVASRAAQIISVGCIWGSQNEETLVQSKPDHSINAPSEITTLIEQF